MRLLSTRWHSIVGLAWLVAQTAATPVDTSLVRRGDQTKFFFVLGDSYSNLAFDPDGTQPSPSNPFGNTNMVARIPEDATLALGPNWVYDLATSYNTTEFLTYNLAFDCAVVNTTLIPDSCPWAKPYNISWQVDRAQSIVAKGSEYGASNGAIIAANALFAIFIGINDASIPIKENRPGIESTLQQDSENLFEQLDRIYSLGFRKFLVLSVPPFDRSPFTLNKNNATFTKAFQYSISLWNDNLQRNYDSWTNRHSDLDSFLFNTTGVFNDVLDNPTAFGANSTGATCYGTLPDCIWADDFHPGPALHKYLAQSIVRYAGSRFAEWFDQGRLTQAISNNWEASRDGLLRFA